MAFKLIFPGLTAIIFLIIILTSSAWSSKIGVQWSQYDFINGQFNYQIGLLIISLLSAAVAYAIAPENFKMLFRLGDITAAGHEVKWLGIKEGDSWLKTGISLSIVITLVTGLFLYLQLRGNELNWSSLWKVFGFIILFSLTNSFAEEIVFRLGIAVPYLGKLAPSTIAVVSALIFGAAHLKGTPGGLLGMFLSGVLGYILTISMIETRGLFWPCLIHFLQDVVILSALFLLNESNTLG